MERPRTAQVLEALKRLAGYSDRQLGDLAGFSRDKIERLRRGIQDMTVNDAEALAAALRVDPSVWFMDPSEAVDYALTRWGAEWSARIRCFGPVPPLRVTDRVVLALTA